MQLDHASEAEQPAGKHALLLGTVLLAQLASNLVLPGVGIAFLGLLFVLGWFGSRADRIVIGIGALVSGSYLAVALLDGVTGPTVGYQFGG